MCRAFLWATGLAGVALLAAGCGYRQTVTADVPAQQNIAPAGEQTRRDATTIRLPLQAPPPQSRLAKPAAAESAKLDIQPDASAAGKSPAAADPSSTSADGLYALLVGVTKYDYLPPEARLRGPDNDTRLMSDLLVEKFKFSAQNIVVLAEHVGKDSHRPLRANIQREFKELAKRGKPGDQVVIFLSGHGSQQPDDDPNDPDDFEPDGLDEIFLPADTKRLELKREDLKKLDPRKLRVPNAISDDEFRKWIEAIRNRGTSVLVIVDACHSGSAVRGAEVERRVPPETLIPKEALSSVRRSPSSKRGAQDEPSPWDVGSKPGGQKQQGGLVAVYAAQADEATVELPLLKKPNGPREFCGLLTFALVNVLNRSESKMTYTELVQEIHSVYVHILGRVGPTPLVEGNDRHKEVLGASAWEGRSRMALRAGPDDKLEVTAGALQGLTAGSILAVYPPPGAKDPRRRLGHVRISEVGTARSLAEPCAHDKLPEPGALPLGGRCELVHLDYGDMRLNVAIEAPADGAASQALWRQQLSALAKKNDAIFLLVDKPEDAQWLVRTANKELVLLPAQGWSKAPAGKPQHFGPVPANEQAAVWLENRLGRIARATMLVRVAGTAHDSHGWLTTALLGKRETNLRAQLLRLKDENNRKGEVVEWKKEGVRLQPGDLMALQLTNTGTQHVDFTLLFVDSGYGIEVLFPPPNRVADNRLRPGQSFTVGPLQIEGDSLGLEHIVVIGLKSQGQPVDFGWLAQDSIEQVRSTAKTRGGAQPLDSPLAKLLQQSLFGAGNTRGMATVDSRDVCLKLVSWYTTPKESKE